MELTWITREILTRGYKTQRQAVVVIHGPTFGLVDTPVWYRCEGKNRLIRFRYALIVDAPPAGSIRPSGYSIRKAIARMRRSPSWGRIRSTQPN